MNKPITVIEPASNKTHYTLSELWEYRELIWLMLTRDIKVRYKQTVLGVAWAVIQPLMMMLIFSFIFGRLANIPSNGLPYPVFVFSALLAWNFLSSAISAGGASLLSASNMISKVYFPRLVIPLASIGVSAVDFIVSFFLLLIIMVVCSVGLTWQIVYFPLFVVGLLLLAFGISTWLAAVTVVYRDFRFVIPFMLQIWMYITPVIYPVSFIPEAWRWLIYLNPAAGWVSGIRAAMLGTSIDWLALVSSSVFTLLILMFGLRYFKRAEHRFADVI